MEHETTWDKLLQIHTAGRDETNADAYHHPYEPTSYRVLARLAKSGFFGGDDVVLDYGCGKGRVGFFLSYRTKARTVGIEYDDRIYECALENRRTTVSRIKPNFVLTRAEEYELPREVNRCYFFNPFSVEILQKVMARILESYYANPREVFLFFYYPSDEYISYLMTVDALEFYDEIECEDLFDGNDPRERILIFWLPDYETGEQIMLELRKMNVNDAVEQWNYVTALPANENGVTNPYKGYPSRCIKTPYCRS